MSIKPRNNLPAGIIAPPAPPAPPAPSVHASDEAIIGKLDELIRATRASNAVWLDADGVAAVLSRDRRYVLERLAPRPDFPRALREGQPRWKRSEVLEWAERRREQANRAA